MSVAPLKVPRLISYFLAFAFGIAGFGLGIHALVQSHKDKSMYMLHLPHLYSSAFSTTSIQTHYGKRSPRKA